MTDREKVIKGLETCYRPPSKCEDCPYHDLPDEQSCSDVLCLDALSLLKEQDNCENCAIAIEDRQYVVRCKDCKHGCECLPPCDDCRFCILYEQRHNKEWFCADGERKKGNYRMK